MVVPERTIYSFAGGLSFRRICRGPFTEAFFQSKSHVVVTLSRKLDGNGTDVPTL